MKETDRQIRGTDVRVTHRCVASCAHCASAGIPGNTDVLSVETAERFLDELTKRWGPPGWILSGGEPMLCPERVGELARLGASRGAKPRLSTNGFWARTPESAQHEIHGLTASGITHFWISTDSFHAEFVPVERVHILIEALREAKAAFFVNFNYLLPNDERLGCLGLPRVRPEIERDVHTLRIHHEIATIVGDGQHGWCRVFDLGRGARLIDALGDLAAEARSVLDRYRDEITRPGVLELAANSDVIYRCAVVGNAMSDWFPRFLDSLSAKE